MNCRHWLVAGMGALCIAGSPAWADEMKDDAIARLVAAHEPDIPLAVGRLAVMPARHDSPPAIQASNTSRCSPSRASTG